MSEPNQEKSLVELLGELGEEKPSLLEELRRLGSSVSNETGKIRKEYLDILFDISCFHYSARLRDEVIEDIEKNGLPEDENEFLKKLMPDLMHMRYIDSIRPLFAFEKYEKVERSFQELRSKNNFDEEKNPYLHFNLGCCHLMMGMEKEAEADFKKAKDLGSKELDINVLLGQLYRERGMYREAEEAFKKGLMIDKDRVTIRDIFQRYQSKRRDLKKAEESPISNPKTSKARIHAELGLCYLRQGRIEEAEDSLNKAIGMDQDDPLANIVLGDLYHKQKRFKEAEPYLKKIVEFDPTDSTRIIHLGDCYLKQERFEEAEQCFKRAIELDPNREGIETPLILVYLKQLAKIEEDTDKEIEILEKLAELEPEEYKWHRDLGNRYKKQDKIEEARKAYEKAWELNPNEFMNNFNLGWIYSISIPKELMSYWRRRKGEKIRRERLRKSAELLEKAEELRPEEAVVHFCLGSTYLNQGIYEKKPKDFIEKAEASFRKAIELDSDQSLYHIKLGDCLSEQKKYDEAEAEYKKALELGDEDAADSLKELKKSRSILGRILSW